MGGGNGGKNRKGHQGTYIKDPWTKSKRVGLRVTSRGMGESSGGEMETTVLER